MEKAFGSGAEAMLTHNDNPIPRANDSHTFHRHSDRSGVGLVRPHLPWVVRGCGVS